MIAAMGSHPATPSTAAGKAQRFVTTASMLAAAWMPAAVQAEPACTVDPFAAPAPADREAGLAVAQRCGGEHLNWFVEPPDPAAAARRTGVLRARIDSVRSEPLLPGLLGSVRLGWAGLGGEPTTGLRTERTVLAAGGLLRLSEDWAVRMELGRDLTADSQRSTVGGSWRPVSTALVFAEWSETPGPAQPQRVVGARWWLLPKLLAVDVQARYEGGAWDGQRVGVFFSLKP